MGEWRSVTKAPSDSRGFRCFNPMQGQHWWSPSVENRDGYGGHGGAESRAGHLLRELLYFHVHAHPGMETAFEMMCTFRQTRDLD
jgi:hypothetical protein